MSLESTIDWTRNKTARVSYAFKHTIPAYSDFMLSLPIWTAQGIHKAAAAIGDKEAWNERETTMLASSPMNQLRERLRANQDTQGASEYLRSYVTGTPAYIYLGVPLANVIGKTLDTYGASLPDVIEKGTNATLTFGAQVGLSYLVMNFAHAAMNRHEFEENGTFKTSKVLKRTLETAKAFALAEIAYGAFKAPLHTMYMMRGMPEGDASVAADWSLIPPWFAIAVFPIAFAYGKQGFINNKTTQTWNADEAVDANP